MTSERHTRKPRIDDLTVAFYGGPHSAEEALKIGKTLLRHNARKREILRTHFGDSTSDMTRFERRILGILGRLGEFVSEGEVEALRQQYAPENSTGSSTG